MIARHNIAAVLLYWHACMAHASDWRHSEGVAMAPAVFSSGYLGQFKLGLPYFFLRIGIILKFAR